MATKCVSCIRPSLSGLLAMAIFCSMSLAAEMIWLETEQFNRTGGWTVDAQFLDQMGSPYVLAVGLGTPVGDAVAQVNIPSPGAYRVWTRTMDWAPEHHPGRFQILFDGKPLSHEFGRSGSKKWGWEDGGIVQLNKQTEVRLRDRTGYYARCDAVLLCRDLDWTPPEGVEAIEKLRIAHGALSPVETMPEHDVVVIGGGLAGCTAAVAAARHGVSVALIQNRPVLGGNASTEILTPPVGVSPGAYRKKYPLDPAETGLIEEYRTAGNQVVSEGKLYSQRLMRFVRQEPNLDLYLNTHATGVAMRPSDPKEPAGKAIDAVLAMDVHTGRRRRFPGRFFIDCTGDAVVGVAAGAEYRHGKESKAMHDEPWAPEQPNRHTMGNGLKYYARDTGKPQTYTPPPWAMKFPSCDDFNPGRHPRLTVSTNIGNQWVNEIGGLRDTYADAEAIRDDLLCLIHGLWDHVKNHCPKYREAAQNYELVWVSYLSCKRENRRLIGDHVLTQNDIGSQRLFRDRVAFGGWICDDHYSAGFFHDGSFGRHYDDPENAHMAVPYSIPWRSLYSRNVDNLLMAGRNISATHLAMSNTRVMLTCAVMGHAVGTGSALCVARDVIPRVLGREHMEELQQQLLKEGACVIGLRADDPRDLARRATATASSARTRETGEVMAPANVLNGHARATMTLDNVVTNAWAPVAKPDENKAGKQEPAAHWLQLAWQEPIALNVVHVTFQKAHRAARWFAIEIAEEKNSLSGGRTTWRRIAEVDKNRHRRLVLGVDRVMTRRLRVVLREPSAICEIRVYDESPEVVESSRRAFRTMRLPDKGPYFPWEKQ